MYPSQNVWRRLRLGTEYSLSILKDKQKDRTPGDWPSRPHTNHTTYARQSHLRFDPPIPERRDLKGGANSERLVVVWAPLSEREGSWVACGRSLLLWVRTPNLEVGWNFLPTNRTLFLFCQLQDRASYIVCLQRARALCTNHTQTVSLSAPYIGRWYCNGGRKCGSSGRGAELL